MNRITDPWHLLAPFRPVEARLTRSLVSASRPSSTATPWGTATTTVVARQGRVMVVVTGTAARQARQISWPSSITYEVQCYLISSPGSSQNSRAARTRFLSPRFSQLLLNQADQNVRGAPRLLSQKVLSTSSSPRSDLVRKSVIPCRAARRSPCPHRWTRKPLVSMGTSTATSGVTLSTGAAGTAPMHRRRIGWRPRRLGGKREGPALPGPSRGSDPSARGTAAARS